MQYRWQMAGAAALVAAGFWYANAGDKPASRRGGRANDPALIERGKYLVTRVIQCGHCHTS